MYKHRYTHTRTPYYDHTQVSTYTHTQLCTHIHLHTGTHTFTNTQVHKKTKLCTQTDTHQKLIFLFKYSFILELTIYHIIMIMVVNLETYKQSCSKAFILTVA